MLAGAYFYPGDGGAGGIDHGAGNRARFRSDGDVPRPVVLGGLDPHASAFRQRARRGSDTDFLFPLRHVGEGKRSVGVRGGFQLADGDGDALDGILVIVDHAARHTDGRQLDRGRGVFLAARHGEGDWLLGEVPVQRARLDGVGPAWFHVGEGDGTVRAGGLGLEGFAVGVDKRDLDALGRLGGVGAHHLAVDGGGLRIERLCKPAGADG